MKEIAVEKLTSLAQYLITKGSKLVIDGDTHPTHLSRLNGELLAKYDISLNYYHGRPISAEDLLLEMRAANVDMSLTWQNPAALEYTTDQEVNYERLYQANEDIFALSQKYPTKFIPAGWTDPKALGVDRALKLVDQCVLGWGFPVVKMNPAQNQYPIDSDMVLTVVDRIVSLGATPAFHYGGDSPFTPASGLQRIAEQYPDHPVIGVHMGGGGSHYVEGEQLYQESRRLGLEHKNIFFILSARRDCHIESDLITYTLASRPYCNNLACGSDAPYGKQTWNFGGFDRMFQALQRGHEHPDKRLQNQPALFTDEIVQGYKGKNLADLIVRSCNSILVKSGAVAKSVL